MNAIKFIFAAALFVVLSAQLQAQTLTYSAGWVNGKRSAPADLPFSHGHDQHEQRSTVVYSNGGPVPISDLQSGRNFLCFDVNPQIKDTLVPFGLKSPDYPSSRPLGSRAMLRNQE